MIITATAQTAMPAADLLVAGMPTGTTTVKISRSYAGSMSTVRDAQNAPTGGASSRPYTDWEIPLGIPTTYTVYAYSAAGAVLGSAQSAAVTADWSAPWISDPLAPGTAVAVELINESMESITHQVQGDRASIVDSGLPVAIAGAVGVGASVPLRFRAATALQGLGVRIVLRQVIFLLRLPADAPFQIPALAYFTFDEYVDEKVFMERDHIVVNGAEIIAAPLSPVVLSPRTYGDLRDEASTYGDVSAAHSSYLGVLRGDPS